MKNANSFWVTQLRFAKANLDFLKYSRGRTHIDQERLHAFIKVQESQIEQCKLAIRAEHTSAAPSKR